MSNQFDPEELDSALQNEFAAASASIRPSEELLEKMSTLDEPTKKKTSSRRGKSRVVFSTAAAFLFLIAGAGFWITTQRDDSTETAQEQQEGEALSNQEAEAAVLKAKIDEKVAQYEACTGSVDPKIWLPPTKLPNYFYLQDEGYIEVLMGETAEAAMGTNLGSYRSAKEFTSEQKREMDKLGECADLGQDQEEISAVFEKFDDDEYLKSEESIRYQATRKELLIQCLQDESSTAIGENGPEDELLARLLEEMEPGLAAKMGDDFGVLRIDEVARKFIDQGYAAIAKEKQAELERIRDEFTNEARCLNRELLLHLGLQSPTLNRFVQNQDISVETKAAYLALAQSEEKHFRLAEQEEMIFEDHIAQSKKLAVESSDTSVAVWFKTALSEDQVNIEQAVEKFEENLKEDPSIETYRYIDQKETVAEMEQYFKNKPEMLELVDQDAVPTSMIVDFASGTSQQQIDDFVAEYKQLPGVESISVIPEEQDQGLAERLLDSLQR